MDKNSAEITTLTRRQRIQCHVTIHAASSLSAAVGAGLAQVPTSDATLLIPIQIGMVTSIGRLFEIEITDAAATGLTIGLIGSSLGRATSQVLVGWVPGVGNAINAGTAACLTEALGWAVANKFARQRQESSEIHEVSRMR